MIAQLGERSARVCSATERLRSVVPLVTTPADRSALETASLIDVAELEAALLTVVERFRGEHPKPIPLGESVEARADQFLKRIREALGTGNGTDDGRTQEKVEQVRDARKG